MGEYGDGVPRRFVAEWTLGEWEARGDGLEVREWVGPGRSPPAAQVWMHTGWPSCGWDAGTPAGCEAGEGRAVSLDAAKAAADAWLASTVKTMGVALRRMAVDGFFLDVERGDGDTQPLCRADRVTWFLTAWDNDREVQRVAGRVVTEAVDAMRELAVENG